MNHSDNSAEEILAIWMKCHADSVVRMLALLTGDADIAQDLTQEVFILAYRKFDQFRGESSVRTYLFRIAINVARSSKRRIAGKPEQLCFVEAPGQAAGPVDEVMAREDKLAVRRAVAGLASPFRETAVLFYFNELPLSEIARVLRVSEGTVKSRLARARKKLEKKLVREGFNHA